MLRFLAMNAWTRTAAVVVITFLAHAFQSSSHAEPATPTTSEAAANRWAHALKDLPQVHAGPVLIYVLSYSDASEALARAQFPDPPFYALPRLPTTPYFESLFYTELAQHLAAQHEWEARTYVGTIAYKAFLKFSDAQAALHAVLAEIAAGNATTADVIALRTEASPQLYGGASARSQGNLPAVWDSSVVAIDSRLKQPFRAFYSNYWLARPPLLLRYCAWLRDMAAPTLSKDSRVLAPVAYKGRVTPEMSAAGMQHYPLAPFLLERLPGAFFQNVLSSSSSSSSASTDDDQGVVIRYLTARETCREVQVGVLGLEWTFCTHADGRAHRW